MLMSLFSALTFLSFAPSSLSFPVFPRLQILLRLLTQKSISLMPSATLE